MKSALRLPRRRFEQLDIDRSCRQVKRMRSTEVSVPQPQVQQQPQTFTRHHFSCIVLIYKRLPTPLDRRKRWQGPSRHDSVSSSSSSSSSSSLRSPRTPTSRSPRPCPSSPSMSYAVGVLQVPFLDSLSSVPPPSPPQYEKEWKQVRGEDSDKYYCSGLCFNFCSGLVSPADSGHFVE